MESYVVTREQLERFAWFVDEHGTQTAIPDCVDEWLVADGIQPAPDPLSAAAGARLAADGRVLVIDEHVAGFVFEDSEGAWWANEGEDYHVSLPEACCGHPTRAAAFAACVAMYQQRRDDEAKRIAAQPQEAE